MTLDLLLRGLATAEGEGQVRRVRAAFSGMVVERLVVGVLAFADAGRAGNGRAAVIAGGDGSTAFLEGIAVDVGQVVEHLAVRGREGVLKLGNVVMGVLEGDFNGDTAAIVVGLVLLRVFGTGVDDFTLINGLVGNRPDVDGPVALVLDDSLPETCNKSWGEGSEGGSSEDGLGIHLVLRRFV